MGGGGGKESNDARVLRVPLSSGRESRNSQICSSVLDNNYLLQNPNMQLQQWWVGSSSLTLMKKKRKKLYSNEILRVGGGNIKWYSSLLIPVNPSDYSFSIAESHWAKWPLRGWNGYKPWKSSQFNICLFW